VDNVCYVLKRKQQCETKWDKHAHVDVFVVLALTAHTNTNTDKHFFEVLWKTLKNGVTWKPLWKTLMQ